MTLPSHNSRGSGHGSQVHSLASRVGASRVPVGLAVAPPHVEARHDQHADVQISEKMEGVVRLPAVVRPHAGLRMPEFHEGSIPRPRLLLPRILHVFHVR